MQEFVKRYIKITFGGILYALGFVLFIEPSSLAPGGVSGISVIVTHFLPKINSGSVILLINLPLLIIGTFAFGMKFLCGTVWATFFSSFVISIIEYYVNPTQPADRFCCAVAGAIFIGVGIGLVFRENATTGGTDIIVRLLQKKFPYIRSGNIFLIVDSSIVIASGIIFRDIETSVYSGVSLAVSTYIFNYIYYGGMRAKLLIIITENAAELSSLLSDETGITIISGVGAYSGIQKQILLCAVDKRKYLNVTQIVKDKSPDSMVITAPADGYSKGRYLG